MTMEEVGPPLEVIDWQAVGEAAELKIAELESYDYISRRADELKMVKVDKIDYISVIDSAVAVK